MNSWLEQNNSLVKEFVFDSFASALTFVNKVGAIAEAMNHHPDLLIHSYNKVRITLSTHSEGKVTEKDSMLANKIDELL